MFGMSLVLISAVAALGTGSGVAAILSLVWEGPERTLSR